MRSPITIFFVALAATLAFFFEYLPPIRIVHIPFDLDAYHFPLFDYAFQSLRHGRLPQWDPSMYSGMDFLANVQAALYYPGTWLMLLLSWGRQRLSYQSVEDLVFLHFPLAFVLCFCWLRARKLTDMAAALGAVVYAYSGYMCLQMQHFGLIGAYAWFPLGLWAIDQAEERASWKPLWKVAMVSALCFLAGYPPSWVVFAVLAGTYAIVGSTGRVGKWSLAAGLVVAVTFGLVLCAVQVLPAWDATHFRQPEDNYGFGFKEPIFYISYFIPNFFDFGWNVPVETNPAKEYLYLGAPGLLGLGVVAWFMLTGRRSWRPLWSGLAVLVVSLILTMNPYNIPRNIILHSSLLADICRSYYFLAGVTLAASLLAAYGLDEFLRGDAFRGEWIPRRLQGVKPAIVVMGVWAIAEGIRWPEADFAHGWKAIWDPLIMLLVFTFSLFVFRRQTGDLRVWVAAALLVSVGVDYKVFGTYKRFDSSVGEGPRFWPDRYTGMNTEAYKTINAEHVSRVLLGEFGPLPGPTRQVGWRIPQGFDPLLTTQYRELIARYGKFRTDRELEIDPQNAEAMRLFGIRYLVTAEAGASYKKISVDPRFKMVGPNDSYFKVFEYLDAQPPYRFEGGGTAAVRTWQPEIRAFDVNASAPGALRLSEQFFPGWKATIDGQPAPVDRWEGAFQSVTVPAGQHIVEFRYRSRYWLLGLAITLLCLTGLVWWARHGGRASDRVDL
ncbi:MAG: YfhO family protein [Acidobacteriota bacterium]